MDEDLCLRGLVAKRGHTYNNNYAESIVGLGDFDAYHI
jgi:hypothetical protein